MAVGLGWGRLGWRPPPLFTALKEQSTLLHPCLSPYGSLPTHDSRNRAQGPVVMAHGVGARSGLARYERRGCGDESGRGWRGVEKTVAASF
ncbi:hypothetical protein PRUPE_4G266800 [Prunus persica]|uniref:Uncharacterized protein n=1 Tax=Prunus persica TaxID=3760 RepID=A0A251PRH3_PRUPE|nr:hypothetical protein PRUPE_4G266800 [Prunus persica]